MALPTELMGLGFSSAQASGVGGGYAAISGAGTVQGDATLIGAGSVAVAGADGQHFTFHPNKSIDTVKYYCL